jgi:hypothetical protein
MAAPVNAGTCEVVASVATVGYEGFATGMLVVARAAASVALGDLAHTYDGTPKAATATPAGRPCGGVELCRRHRTADGGGRI